MMDTDSYIDGYEPDNSPEGDKSYVWLNVLLIAALITSSISFGLYQRGEKLNLQTHLQGSYQRSFYEVVGYVDNVSLMIEKIRLSRLPQQGSVMFANLWRYADLAKQNLVVLPYEHGTISNTLKYLSQVSDYSYFCLDKTSQGIALDSEDWEKIDRLYEYSVYLRDDLNAIAADVGTGSIIDWESIGRESGEALAEDTAGFSAENITGSLIKVSKQFQEYPALIYDGPFSDHITDMEPRMTKNAPQISIEEGLTVVKDFLRYDNIIGIKYTAQSDIDSMNTIAAYYYDVLLGSPSNANNEANAAPQLSIAITQQGGYPLWMLSYADDSGASAAGIASSSLAGNLSGTTTGIGSLWLSPEDAKTIARFFMDENGYPNMVPSYYEVNYDTVIVNFCPEKDGVKLYPDLAKVKVSLVSGQVVGFESLGYLMMHEDRDIPEPRLTETQAKQYISQYFNITEIRRALIPLSSKKEVYCYEFLGEYDGSQFLIYINSDTGKQEKILKLLISDNGTLAE